MRTDIVIDIETVPQDARVGMDLTTAPGWTPPATQLQRRTPPSNWKDPAKIAAFEEQETARYAGEVAAELDSNRAAALEEWRRGSLDWRYVRIVCIGYAIGDEDPVVIECDSDEAEDKALREIAQLTMRYRTVTFGDYDQRMIRARASKRRAPIGRLNPIGMKPWDFDAGVVDMQALWAKFYNGSPRTTRNISVDNLCAFHGIERPDNPITGAGVLDAYVEGRMDDIVAHCADDVRVERELWWILRGYGA